VVAQGWLRELLESAASARPYGKWLLLPSSRPPRNMPAPGHQVCTCFNVREHQIEAELSRTEGDADTRLGALQERLKCGTNCGSCLPELRRLVRGHAPATA
jgi:assimilatory nitrate reductase catalytic subunit